MLFNSYGFIFVFLPITLTGFFVCARHSHRLAALWLALASLFFYGWWNPAFLGLLILSILFNYGAGYAIGHARTRHAGRRAALLLTAAIAADLLLLAYFKYANFLIRIANDAGTHWKLLDIVLPLGISFFTFTQIAFLVDVKRGVAREYNFIHYLLFVTYFPHLIAGPVLHHKQMMPQFARKETYAGHRDNIAIGLTIFALGLFKKVVLADQLALYANAIFDAAASGGLPKFVEAWAGALAYTLQLYFDFSGYSDMAIGLARLFNIKLPLNFNSPYKARNMIEFWRRWHMTLSAFLREYLYFSLGGNRKGVSRRYMNLMITMLLGGMWHGAGWNFILWGGLHGIYLSVNHAWHEMTGRARNAVRGSGVMQRLAGTLFTFALVVTAWVFFRAPDLKSAQRILSGMAGINGLSLGHGFASHIGHYTGKHLTLEGLFTLSKMGSVEPIAWILMGLSIVWFLPNSQEWMFRASPAWDTVKANPWFAWRPTRAVAIIVGVMLAVSLVAVTRTSHFLYFQF